MGWFSKKALKEPSQITAKEALARTTRNNTATPEDVEDVYVYDINKIFKRIAKDTRFCTNTYLTVHVRPIVFDRIKAVLESKGYTVENIRENYGIIPFSEVISYRRDINYRQYTCDALNDWISFEIHWGKET